MIGRRELKLQYTRSQLSAQSGPQFPVLNQQRALYSLAPERLECCVRSPCNCFQRRLRRRLAGVVRCARFHLRQDQQLTPPRPPGATATRRQASRRWLPNKALHDAQLTPRGELRIEMGEHSRWGRGGSHHPGILPWAGHGVGHIKIVMHSETFTPIFSLDLAYSIQLWTNTPSINICSSLWKNGAISSILSKKRLKLLIQG